MRYLNEVSFVIGGTCIVIVVTSWGDCVCRVALVLSLAPPGFVDFHDVFRAAI